MTPSMITVSGSSLPACFEQPQQVGVEAVPDAGLLPGPQPAVGGAAGAAQFRRDILPAAAGGQDEPDDPEDDPVPDPGPAALGADGLLGRQVMGDGVEELCPFGRRVKTVRVANGLARGGGYGSLAG